MNKLFLLFLLFQVTIQTKIEKSRAGRLLYISTTSTTTTVTTTSLCWKAGTTIAACTGRKRRALLTELGLDEDLEVSATRAELEGDNLENDEELESGQKESQRDGRFMMYWKTESYTSTTTTYTKTSTVASLECTPSKFDMRSC